MKPSIDQKVVGALREESPQVRPRGLASSWPICLTNFRRGTSASEYHSAADTSPTHHYRHLLPKVKSEGIVRHTEKAGQLERRKRYAAICTVEDRPGVCYRQASGGD